MPGLMDYKQSGMNATEIEIESPQPQISHLASAQTKTETRTATGTSHMASPAKSRKKIPLWLAAVGLAVVAACAGWRWWVYSHTWITTDNAYVSGHIHAVSTRIPGTVSEVLATENQEVVEGAVLVRLDAQDLEVQRDKARALLAQAEAELAQARAQVTRDEAITDKAQLDFNRADRLFCETNSVISQSEFDGAKAALVAARGSLEVARAAVLAAKAQTKAATAQLKDVELQLSYTEIIAPTAGRIGRKNVEVGNRIQSGQPLLALVEPEVWVTANFKETQLKRLRPGQMVRLSVDAFSGHDFVGRVESLSPASGAQFALLPPDNATGNFTKIVQRVPVKIVFDHQSVRDFAGSIVPGMSAVVKVNVQSDPGGRDS